MNSQMTDFAFAGKWGDCGASGFRERTWGAGAPSSPWPSSNPASASRPKPPPLRRSMSRRDQPGMRGVTQNEEVAMSVLDRLRIPYQDAEFAADLEAVPIDQFLR